MSNSWGIVNEYWKVGGNYNMEMNTFIQLDLIAFDVRGWQLWALAFVFLIKYWIGKGFLGLALVVLI